MTHHSTYEGTPEWYYSNSYVLPSVRARVILGVAPHLDGEELGPIATIQLLEAVHRYPRRPRNELQQTCSHLIGEGQHHLECIPSMFTFRLTVPNERKSENVLEQCVYKLSLHKQLSLSQSGMFKGESNFMHPCSYILIHA